MQEYKVVITHKQFISVTANSEDEAIEQIESQIQTQPHEIVEVAIVTDGESYVGKIHESPTNSNCGSNACDEVVEGQDNERNNNI